MSEGTLMTAAATTTESQPASDLATQQPDTASGNGSAQQQSSDAASANGQNPESSDSGTGQGNQQDVVPEQYEDFKAPDGLAFDAGVMDSYKGAAKELGLSQDKAQMLLDKVSPVIHARQQEQLQALSSEWEKASKSDKEFGGDKLQENLGVAQKAMEAFASPELKTLLKESGLGNHPEFVRMFYRAGKAISEDTLVNGSTSSGGASKTLAQNMYPNMNP